MGLARPELGRDSVRQELHGLARSQPTAQQVNAPTRAMIMVSTPIKKSTIFPDRPAIVENPCWAFFIPTHAPSSAANRIKSHTYSTTARKRVRSAADNKERSRAISPTIRPANNDLIGCIVILLCTPTRLLPTCKAWVEDLVRSGFFALDCDRTGSPPQRERRLLPYRRAPRRTAASGQGGSG